MKQPESHRRPLHPFTFILAPYIGVLLLSLAFRAAWIARFPADPLGPVDAEGYHRIAWNLLAGRGFSMAWAAPFCPVAVRTPG